MPTPLSEIHDGSSALQAAELDRAAVSATVEESNDWILAATLARHAAIATESKAQRKRLLSAAAKLSRERLGPTALASGCQFDEWPARKTIDVLRLLAERCEAGGALTLAGHLLESLGACAESEEDEARTLADRARNSRKRGFLDLARAQAEEVKRRAAQLRSADLAARAWNTLASIAQVMGNSTEARRCARKGRKIAEEAGLTRMAAAAHGGLGVMAAMRQAYSEGVTHLWAAYSLTSKDSRAGHSHLTNLAHVFFVSGHPEEAKAVSSSVLAASPRMGVALAALGVYALSSARLAQQADVEWACAHVLRLARGKVYPREVAVALTDCACALEYAGFATRAATLKRRAEALAERHGFHDLVFEEGVVALNGTSTPRQPLNRDATKAAVEVVDSAPDARAFDLQTEYA